MRISDWSSDVCSSDLHLTKPRVGVDHRSERRDIAGRGNDGGKEGHGGPRNFTSLLCQKSPLLSRSGGAQDGRDDRAATRDQNRRKDGKGQGHGRGIDLHARCEGTRRAERQTGPGTRIRQSSSEIDSASRRERVYKKV